MTVVEDRTNIVDIYSALRNGAQRIYCALKSKQGLTSSGHVNSSGDVQLLLDEQADNIFLLELSKCQAVQYVVSEERPDLADVNNGPFSVALDPLDGSKAALVGIPSGAIYCIFKDATEVSGFSGRNVVASGFFVFGLNLEIYFADDSGVFNGVFDEAKRDWVISPICVPLPSSDFFAINASNRYLWDGWLQKYYDSLINVPATRSPNNLRWYASMVSEIKRLILQGGVYAYPSDERVGYENGHLRLVYEAIPMAFLIGRLGGSSSDGTKSILETEVLDLHQKTPVFLGEAQKIADLESFKALH